MILETVSGEISFAAVETSVVDFVKVDAFHVILQDVLPFTNLHQANNFKKFKSKSFRLQKSAPLWNS